ncbi:MAG: DUF308 domain-containing protein [Methanolinea sp.]|nr:DUF308 domain-containing protein [Methanolinea sp.]
MAEETMEESLCRMKWSTFVLTGVMALFFGILFFLFPALTAEVIVTLLGIIIIVLSIFAITLALMSRVGDTYSAALLIGGLCGFLVGVGAIVSPVLFGAFLSIILGAVLFVTGVINIAMGTAERDGRPRWSMYLLGIVSIIFSVILMLYPLFGSIILFGYLVGVYFVLYGIMLIWAGFIVKAIIPDFCPRE